MKEELERAITSKWAGKNLVYFKETDSTNIQAKELAKAGAAEGTLVVADMQNAGRGRTGRTWISEGGENVYMSIVLRPDLDPTKASMITLVAALAVSVAIKEVTGLETKIKWPNDLVFEDKKVCGILTEMSCEANVIRYIVTGIGINLNVDSFPDEIKDKATSLKIALSRDVRRADIIDAVMRSFEHYYAKYIQTGDMSLLLDEYQERLVNMKRTVRVLSPQEEYDGTAQGINASGELIVLSEDGKIHTVCSGEVSVRGLYGYV